MTVQLINKERKISQHTVYVCHFHQMGSQKDIDSHHFHKPFPCKGNHNLKGTPSQVDIRVKSTYLIMKKHISTFLSSFVFSVWCKRLFKMLSVVTKEAAKLLLSVTSDNFALCIRQLAAINTGAVPVEKVCASVERVC